MPKAEQISFLPAGSITSVDVQTAIEQLAGQIGGAVGVYLPVFTSANSFQSISFNVVSVDATSSNKTVLTPQSPAEGDLLIVRKVDSSANVVIVSGPSFLLRMPGESVEFVYAGGNWVPTTVPKASNVPVLDELDLFQGTNVEDVLAELGQYNFRSYTQERYTATEGQTVFNLLNPYTTNTNSLQVYMNGLMLSPSVDYNETGTSQITLTAPAVNGDSLLFNIGFTVNEGTPPNINFLDESQILTEGQTAINLSTAYTVGVNTLSLYLNGVRLLKQTDFVETNSTTLTLTNPATAGDTAYIQIGQLVNGLNPTTSDQVQHIPTGGGSTTNVRDTLNGHKDRIENVEGDAVYYRATKSAADALAASLPDGATVIVDRDETLGGGPSRYTLIGDVLVLSNAGLTINNIAEMQAATWLKVGDIVRTLGYSSVGDGGANDYVIVAAATGVVDDGSYINLAGSSLQAKGLFIDGVARPEQFGIFGGGATNELSKLKLYFSYEPARYYELAAGKTYYMGTVSTNEKHFYIKLRERFKVVGNDAWFKCESVHGVTPLNYVFYLEDTNNIDIDGVNGDGVSFVRDAGSSGTMLFHIHNETRSTTGVKIRTKGKKMYRMVGATSANPALYRTRNVKLYSECNSGYYNVNLANNCDDLKGRIVSNDMVRSYFPYGVENHDVHVISRNHYKFTDCLIKAYEFNTRNIKVRYELYTSLSSDAVCTVEHQSDTQNKKIEDIEFDVNIRGHVSSYQFTISQFNMAAALQPTTSSIISNIRYKGVIHGRSLKAANFNITVSPNQSSLLIVEPSLNPVFADTKGFVVVMGNKLIRAKSGDLNGTFGIPMAFSTGNGWSGRLSLYAIENQAQISLKSTSRIYNLLGSTVNPQPSTIVASDLVSDLVSAGPLNMTIDLSSANNSEGLPSVGVNISGHPPAVTGYLFLELEINGGALFTGWN